MSKKNNSEKPKKINLNSYWIYGLIIFLILAMNIVTIINGKTIEISGERFKEIATKNHIEKVEVIKNLEEARIYLKESALDKYDEI